MTDPIGDMLTRIRNALTNRKRRVVIPRSKVKLGVADVLKREGYISDYRTVASKASEDSLNGWIEIDLKYGVEGESALTYLQRVSTPGRRAYSKVDDLPLVLNGLGISVLSTSQGIVSDREARTRRIGGEVLCTVY